MGDLLRIEGGPAVVLGERPAQGTRHELRFGVLATSGTPVAVKLQRVGGALERERTALEWVGARGGPVPRIVAAGTVVTGDGPTACLVTLRMPGRPPTRIRGWYAMGRAHAGVARDDMLPNGLPILDPAAVGRAHARRVEELGDRLAPVATAIPDWPELCSPELPEPARLVLTHGDPGPGNFLDDGRTGMILDWEEAHVAPEGLDLARLHVIALLGAGPRGYVGRDRAQRARAAQAGYLAGRGARPSRAQRRWWVAVAGVQFVHHRWRSGERPGPWPQAVGVLREALGGRAPISEYTEWCTDGH